MIGPPNCSDAPTALEEAIIAMGDEQVFCGGTENLLSEEEERKLLSSSTDGSKI